MCGIVGYVGPKQAQPIILDGLKRLEYRGYDSAGLAVLLKNGQVSIRRQAGKLAKLERAVAADSLVGTIGMGHTRWATHGKPNARNAHPHTSMNEDVVLVHNGILENYLQLRDELETEGVTFRSETDSEVIVQLIERYLSVTGNFEQAMQYTLQRLEGSNAIVTLSRLYPDRLLCAKLGNAGGITIGIGDNEMYIASDIPAILPYTNQVVFLADGQMASITQGDFELTDLRGNRVESKIEIIPWDPVSAIKGEYKHFMLKEIFDQPQGVIDTLRGKVDFENLRIDLRDLNLTQEKARALKRIHIVACGSSYYAALVGKYLIESIARLPVEVSYGSEFRYQQPLLDSDMAVLSITQSGETADTLAAMELAQEHHVLLWSIVNVYGSQSMRIADGYIAMQAGPEIGVATTKAFVVSLVDLYLLACQLGHYREIITDADLRQHIHELMRLPHLVGLTLERAAGYADIANLFYRSNHFLFIGRGINYPIAMEGALKLKEISYIHAEGYPAGEMKHGPIALIDEDMPVVAIATRDAMYPKMISQIEQASSRGGTVIALATDSDEDIQAKAKYILYVPETPPLLAPIVNIIPLQLLSYHMALRRGCDVDQPRNLAKSVTVE